MKLELRGDASESEGKLGPLLEFAHSDPPLKPGQLQPAAEMANKLIAWLVGKRKHGHEPTQRVLRAEHFDFRGGERGVPDQ